VDFIISQCRLLHFEITHITTTFKQVIVTVGIVHIRRLFT